MRYMIIHKTNAHWETGAPPGPEVIKQVGQMIGELQKAGAFLGGEGLRATSFGARVRSSAGRREVQRGPFGPDGKVPVAYAIVKASSLDEALELVAPITELVGGSDVRPVTEAWDIGIIPVPANVTHRRYMALFKGARPTGPDAAKLQSYLSTLSTRGVLLAADAFEETGKRIAVESDRKKRTVTDGPFAETKELVGGFAMVEAKSLDEAVRWANLYIDAVETDEVDVRAVNALA